MREVVDQMGRKIVLSSAPGRIVSVVPSQTELFFSLNRGHLLIGRTKFCIHPSDKIKSILQVGGTKNLHLDRIRDLTPDLIIGNKEENDQGQMEELMKEFPVWMSDIETWEDALEMISNIATLVRAAESGQKLLDDLTALKEGYVVLPQLKRARILYLIWNDPIMIAASGTFINEMLQIFGVANAAAHLKRYPEVSEEELAAINPTHIFLSSEPFPFSNKHIARYQRICPEAVIHIVDGELFSWYGPRMLNSMEYFKELSNKI